MHPVPNLAGTVVAELAIEQQCAFQARRQLADGRASDGRRAAAEQCRRNAFVA